MTWHAIETAPARVGMDAMLLTESGMVLHAEWCDGFIEQLDDGTLAICGAWCAISEDYPPSWTDGVCWGANARGEPSDPPVAWRPIE